MPRGITRTRALGTISSTVEKKQMGEAVESRQQTDHVPVEVNGPHGYVMVKGGATENIGDYNSVSVQVSIGMPCDPTIEAAKQKYEEISLAVDELVRKELLNAKGEPQPDV